MSTFKDRWSKILYVPKLKWILPLVMISLIISSVIGYLIPQYMQKVYSNYKDVDLFYSSLTMLGIVFVGVFVNRAIYSIMINKYIEHLITLVRTVCYKKWILNEEIKKEKSNEKVEFPMGEVLARIISDTEALRELVNSGSLAIIIDVVFILSCLVSFLEIHLESGAVLIAAQIISILFLIKGSKYLAKVFFEVRVSSGKLSKTVANVTGGLSEMYYNNHYNYASKKCLFHFEDFLKKQLKANIYDASFYSVADSLYPIFLIVLVATASMTGLMETAIVAVMIDLIQRSISPIKDVTGKISSFQRAYSGIVRIEEFLFGLKNSSEEKLTYHPEKIEFQELVVKVNYFTYQKKGSDEESFELKNVQFTGKSGELIGIVGSSGCGKSTLLKILATEILPIDFSITLIEKNLEEINYPSIEGNNLKYREQIGIVSQDSHIFSENLSFNISMDEEMTTELETFFENIKNDIPYIRNWGIQLDSKIKVADLSMGQKQLVSALRACFLQKPIVLLDEISSGLDPSLEEALRLLVLKIQKFSLTIIVAHRLETVIKADKILVMKNGQLISEGNHQELMESSEVYQSLLRELSS